MDRVIVYQGEIPLDTDILNTNQNAMLAIGKLAGAVFGQNQILNGFTCTPTSPASMQIILGYGEIYSPQNVDNSTYGSLTLDNSDQVMKQGITFATNNLNFTAPTNVGQSINYLIEIAFLEQDINSTVLGYYNAANIVSPLQGPGGNGVAQANLRQNTVTIAVKNGVAGNTGTQATPSPDTGFTGAYIVTLAYGQTTITASNISVYSTASFVGETLPQKISQATADLRYTQATRVQAGYYNIANDTGTSNNYIASITPAVTSYAVGLNVDLVVANTNTGASTFNLCGVGAQAIKLGNGNALVSGQMPTLAYLTYTGSYWQLSNPNTTATTSSSILKYFTSSTTWTVPANITNLMIEVWGAGGGGSGGVGSGSAQGSGGGGGGYGLQAFTVTPGITYTVTIGAGGAYGAVGANGSSGGLTSFGGLISATGGAAGVVNGLGGTGGTSSATFSINGGGGGQGFVAASGIGGGSGRGGLGGTPGSAGTTPGGGGNGGGQAATGGAGMAGAVLIWGSSTALTNVAGTTTTNAAYSPVLYAQVNFGASGTQSISAATLTKIQFPNKVTDANGWWDNVNYQYTNLTPGKYRVTSIIHAVQIPTSGSNVGNILIQLQKNGAMFLRVGEMTFNNNNLASGHGSVIVPITATTDTLSLAASCPYATAIGQDSGAATSTTNVNTNLFEIQYLGT